ncbi:hypothetical protein [Xanthomonas campestris]|uniref:hypothetical protein n=1 Tax=Xanthomonas campestris TaxID=339 RepID=UPI0005AED68F|nr:hypothetical protein [Xanthomonas campestris]KIQ29383.1 hypothetical protein RT95_02040 [Xanthomonas campestris]
MSQLNKCITLIGGPADGMQHIADVCARTLVVAHFEREPIMGKPGELIPLWDQERTSTRSHTYLIRRVGNYAWVGVHESIA